MSGRTYTPLEIEVRSIISQRLNRLLNESGKTKSEITSTCKIPASTLTGYFAGTRLPDSENVIKMANFFHVSPDVVDPRFSEKLLSKLDEENKDETLSQALSHVSRVNGVSINDHDRQLMAKLFETYIEMDRKNESR